MRPSGDRSSVHPSAEKRVCARAATGRGGGAQTACQGSQGLAARVWQPPAARALLALLTLLAQLGSRDGRGALAGVPALLLFSTGALCRGRKPSCLCVAENSCCAHLLPRCLWRWGMRRGAACGRSALSGARCSSSRSCLDFCWRKAQGYIAHVFLNTVLSHSVTRSLAHWHRHPFSCPTFFFFFFGLAPPPPPPPCPS